MKSITTTMIDNRKKKYYEGEVNKLRAQGADRIHYKILKNITDTEQPPPWRVESLAKRGNLEELAENLASYFSSISQEYPALDRGQIPRTYDKPVNEITPAQVAERIRTIKKPSSNVQINPLPRFLTSLANPLAAILTPIINSVRSGGSWPDIWKEEEGTVIPKCSLPEGFGQLRNISCTSIFSKICESFLLDWLLEEIPFNPTQFGARKGAGTDHLLTEMITDQLECLDDNRAATTFISIDFAKAFNRMDHQHCLKSMATQGASDQTLSMAASFLAGRRMRIKLSGGTYSKLKRMPGGAPQGTKSGNLLFCTSVADIHLPTRTEQPEGATHTAIDPPYDPPMEEAPSSPLGGSRYDLRLVGKRDIFEDDSHIEWPPPEYEHEPPPRWKREEMIVKKFIDDVNAREKCDITAGRSLFTTKKEQRFIHAAECQAYLNTIIERSRLAGMVVNPEKTQLLCTTTAINYEIRSYITIDGKEIISRDTLKMVGYTFGRRPGASEHLKIIRKKYGARTGILRHLKKMSFCTKIMTEVYCSLIRPVLEYSANAFHTTLTQEQEEALERLQRMALKTIHGWTTPYRECLELSQIDKLSARRERLFRVFTKKSFKSDRFKMAWFTYKTPSIYGLRKQDKVVQNFANCDRLQCAPIYKMRQLINAEDL